MDERDRGGGGVEGLLKRAGKLLSNTMGRVEAKKR